MSKILEYLAKINLLHSHKRCIYNLHITNKILPTVEKLRWKLLSDKNFNASERSLRRIIKALGFKRRSAENNRKVLTEKSNRSIIFKKYRPIICSDRTYVHASLVVVLIVSLLVKHGLMARPKVFQTYIERSVYSNRACRTGSWFCTERLSQVQIRFKVG